MYDQNWDDYDYDSGLTDVSSIGTSLYNNSLSSDYENYIKNTSSRLYRRDTKSYNDKLAIYNINNNTKNNDHDSQRSHNKTASLLELNQHKNTNKKRINNNNLHSSTNTFDSSFFESNSNEKLNENRFNNQNILNTDTEDMGNPDETITKDIIFDSNGLVKSGKLEAIVDYLIKVDDDEYRRSLVFCTLLCSRIFEQTAQTFKDLFNKILYEHSTYGIYNKEIINSSLGKLVNVLTDWSQMFPYDFRNQKMMKNYRNLTNKCLNMDLNYKEDIIGITSNLLVDIRNLELYESYLNKIHYEASLKLKKSVIETNILIISNEPRVLAQQLTHIELDRLKHISAEEFIQYCNLFDPQNRNNEFTYNDYRASQLSLTGSQYSFDAATQHSNDNNSNSPKMNKNTSNIEAYIQWFNRLSNLVSTEITKHLKRDTRVKMINFFIDVAQECFNMGNFNSLMAIIASLNTNCVSRLKKTWSKIDRSKLNILQKHLEFNNNYSSYRQLLETAKAQINDRNSTVVIPLFCIVMKDLTSLNDGIPNKFDNGHINFEKFWKIAKYISEILNLKNVNCSYTEKSKIINYLLTTPLLTEDACVLASYECEPPESDSEKRHRDRLRLKVQDSTYFYQSFD